MQIIGFKKLGDSVVYKLFIVEFKFIKHLYSQSKKNLLLLKNSEPSWQENWNLFQKMYIVM